MSSKNSSNWIYYPVMVIRKHQFYCAFIFLAILSPALASEEVPESFSSYNLLEFPEGGELYVAPNLVTKKELFSIKYEGVNIETFKKKKKKYGFTFDMGASEDPGFTIHIWKKNKWQDIGITSGYRLYLSASGAVYSEGHSNNYFNVRRKYQLINDKLVETKQALLLVDFDCKTSNLMKMRASMAADSKVVARLPKGNSVKVIASKFYFAEQDLVMETNGFPFLVSTSFGLVGWVNINPGYLDRPGDPVNCITYFGD